MSSILTHPDKEFSKGFKGMKKNRPLSWKQWENKIDKVADIARNECGIFMINVKDWDNMKKAIEFEITMQRQDIRDTLERNFAITEHQLRLQIPREGQW